MPTDLELRIATNILQHQGRNARAFNFTHQHMNGKWYKPDQKRRIAEGGQWHPFSVLQDAQDKADREAAAVAARSAADNADPVKLENVREMRARDRPQVESTAVSGRNIGVNLGSGRKKRGKGKMVGTGSDIRLAVMPAVMPIRDPWQYTQRGMGDSGRSGQKSVIGYTLDGMPIHGQPQPNQSGGAGLNDVMSKYKFGDLMSGAKLLIDGVGLVGKYRKQLGIGKKQRGGNGYEMMKQGRNWLGEKL